MNHTDDRDWEKRRAHGYISAGNGEKYSRPLLRLNMGDTIAVYQKKQGYLGVGIVRTSAVAAADYRLPDDRPITDIEPSFARREAGKEEYVVGIDWIKAVSVADAQTFDGAFANPNVVCKLRDEPTLKFLQEHLGLPKPAGDTGKAISNSVG